MAIKFHCCICHTQLQAAQALLSNWTWYRYHTLPEMTSFLTALSVAYSDTCELHKAGSSELGKPIWVLRATAGIRGYPLPAGHASYNASSLNASFNASTPPLAARNFSRPIATLLGNMHGDEDVNRELLLRTCLQLCSSRSSTSNRTSSTARTTSNGANSTEAATAAAITARLSALLETTEVHILPSLNPDGAFKTSGGKPAPIRENANGYDLNRNFWSPAFSYSLPVPGANEFTGAGAAQRCYQKYGDNCREQAETKAVKAWLGAHRPAVSANMHGGDLGGWSAVL